MRRVSDKVDTTLDLSVEMSTFYVREMLSHQGSPTASLRLKHQVARLAPKLAAYLFTIVGGELRYYGNEGAECDCGCHCEDCHDTGGYTVYRHIECLDCGGKGEWEDEDCEGHDDGTTCTTTCYSCGGSGKIRNWDSGKHRGDCGSQYAGSSGEPDLYGLSDRMREFISDHHANMGIARNDAWAGWWDWADEGGSVTDMLNEAATLFDNDDNWAYGFGGGSWATIAKLTRDYYLGKMSPTTFVDRVWSVEHNGGNAFDKGYGDQAHRLAGLLMAQYDDDYDVLLRYCDGETVELWQNRNHMSDRRIGDAVIPRFHEDRDDAWLGVQRIKTERTW